MITRCVVHDRKNAHLKSGALYSEGHTFSRIKIPLGGRSAVAKRFYFLQLIKT